MARLIAVWPHRPGGLATLPGLGRLAWVAAFGHGPLLMLRLGVSPSDGIPYAVPKLNVKLNLEVYGLADLPEHRASLSPIDHSMPCSISRTLLGSV
jgi:hypothetical protein